MAFEPTETREFDVLRVGPLQRTPKGNPFIECDTSVGTVAFWGERSMDNLRAIQKHKAPFWIRCGCRPPMPNFPSHALWVPEAARLEFSSGAGLQGAPSTATRAVDAPVPVLYVINCTKAKIWDDDVWAPTYVPAQDAYRGRTVRKWLASAECKDGARWVFLSAKYGFLEPDHPIGKYDVTFSDPSSGPITDEALLAQVHAQRRWHDRVPLRDFRIVYVWSESATYEQKARFAFHGVDAKIVRLADLTTPT